jgi:hypothetical protein
MLRRALRGIPVIAGFGPIYETDPGEVLLAPFRRSAIESGWEGLEESGLAPDSVLGAVREMRSTAVDSFGDRLLEEHGDLVDWARAGLVLEVARRHGVNVIRRGLLRPNWRLRGTVTGRFGVEPLRGFDRVSGRNWVFNPLSLGPDDRPLIRASDACRQVAVLDFRGMDVCSMVSIVPGLAEIYAGHDDPHQRTADLTGLTRAAAKQGFLSWAYGASFAAMPEVGRAFDVTFPSVKAFTRGMDHGDFPRMVQMTSALAFRAALSRALPMLVGMHHLPMFVVHDELVVDCSELGLDMIGGLVSELESGASERVGVSYRVGVSTGYTYGEAKGVH